MKYAKCVRQALLVPFSSLLVTWFITAQTAEAEWHWGRRTRHVEGENTLHVILYCAANNTSSTHTVICEQRGMRGRETFRSAGHWRLKLCPCHVLAYSQNLDHAFKSMGKVCIDNNHRADDCEFLVGKCESRLACGIEICSCSAYSYLNSCMPYALPIAYRNHPLASLSAEKNQI